MNRQNNPKFWLTLIITTPFQPIIKHTKHGMTHQEEVYDNAAFPGLAHFPDNQLESYSYDPRK